MLARLNVWVLKAPAVFIAAAVGITVFFATQLPNLRWETDARVYMPKGHPAILYDEKVEHIFGAKDAVIIAIENDQGVFNPETLARIARVTEKVAALPGVVANRLIDVASLSTASVFEGSEDAIGTRKLMPRVPTSAEEIEQLKKDVYANPDLFIGNIVSKDGTAAMIRAKLKEGIATRYQAYWQIKGIISGETGEGGGWSGGDWSGGDWGGGDWGGGNWGAEEGGQAKSGDAQSGAGDWQSQWQSKNAAQPAPSGQPAGQWPQGGQASPSSDAAAAPSQGAQQSWGGGWGGAAKSTPIADKFYLAGRPVIEVTSGQEAMKDIKVMVPLLLGVIAFMLFAIFRTARGVLLPLAVMAMGVVWTMGSMAFFDVPLYTISTMLPVILVAVGIGDGIHLMSHYYDKVLENPQRPSREIVAEVMENLGSPLIVTSLTTAIGFLTLWFAEMPPFKVFGVFTVVGILACWLLSVTFIPAVLALLKPKVGGYLRKRQSLRVRSEQSRVVHALVVAGDAVYRRAPAIGIATLVAAILALLGASKLYVDSSWLSDFRKDSDLVVANEVINAKFSGTLKLHVIVDGKRDGALKALPVLQAIDALQKHLEAQPHVGDSLSIVDYLKSMNKTLHASDPQFDVLPATSEEIAEYLFLFSISGRPDELDEVVDFNYRQANVTIMIKTDHTRELRALIDDVKAFAAERFAGLDVDVNLAGSANNSYLWADLLIDSQTTSIVFSKVAIFLLAALLFRSIIMGLLVVLPVTLTTLVIAGISGGVGIPIDVSTALAAGVAIGVGVDYAIHYLYRYRRLAADSPDRLSAIRGTVRSVGKTILVNAVVVTAGFAVLFFSVFPPHVKLGYFVAAYMVLSCVAALLALPLALRWVKGPRGATAR